MTVDKDALTESRVALITGSTTGLGKAIALRLGRAGAKIALNYVNQDARAKATLDQFRAEGIQCELYQASVIDEAEINRLVSTVTSDLGSIDILVANATCDQPQRPIEDYDWSDYQRMLDYFVKSPLLLTKAVLAGMKSRRWGRIVNIGSEVFKRGAPNFSAYVAAKGAQEGWTRSMASELAPWGITVNIVCPGWIPVERHAADSQDAKDRYLDGIPMQRWGVPADVAAAVAFFAADDAAFMTGQSIQVSGGVTVG
ncbi:MAG: SDR family oxidoreductase [Myxococcota bacterium]|nr:SDR family oxidoreductase [Myxococcota bacterium]